MKINKCGISDIDDYCEDVLTEKIPTCIYTKQAVERFQRDLERVDDDSTFPYYFEPKAAEHFFNFVEEYLQHFQGRFSGRPIHLEPFQKFIVGQIFGWLNIHRHEDTPIRRFSEASIFMGKKNGKSMLGAFIALYFMLFEGDASEIYNIAMNRSHSMKLSWNSAVQMIKNSEELEELFKLNMSVANYRIKCEKNGSFYEPISTNSDTADGLNVSCAIFDESKDNTDFKMVDTIKAGTTTRLNPLFLNISTAGFRTDTVGYRYYQRDVDILSGDTQNDSVLSIIYTIDKGDEEKWDDEDVWRKANPLFDVTITKRYFDDRIKEGKSTVRVKNDILVKNLNVFGKSAEGWIDISLWDECENEELSISDCSHLPAIITFDIASKLDLTNMKITFFEGDTVDNVKLYVFDRFYLPSARFERDDERSEKYLSLITEWRDEGHLIEAGGESIDYQMITHDIFDMCEDYDVRYISYDDWHSSAIIKDLTDLGVEDEKFITYTQAGYKNWDQPMKDLEKLIVDERIIHGGNKVQRWCMENVTTKENTYDSIRPHKISAERKIDGAVTMIMSVGTFIKAGLDNDGGKTKRRLSPIAERIQKMKEDKEKI